MHRRQTAPARFSDAALGLEVPVPDFRYFDPGVAPRPSGWREENGQWEWTDGVLHCRLITTPTESGSPLTRLDIEIRVLHPVRVERSAVLLRAAATHPPTFWSRRSRWDSLRGVQNIPELTPLAVRWISKDGRPAELRSIRNGPAARLTFRDGLFTLTLILESGALHPRWFFGGPVPRSRSSPMWDAGTKFTTSLYLWTPEGVGPSATLSSYPEGREAGFVITDHCDFDTTDRLRVFTEGADGERGWARRGLRFTKGVFTIRSVSPGRTPVPCLEDPEYEDLIRALAADGNEIAPHGVNESGNVPGDTFRRALDRLASTYQPGTWIDHGVSLKYCYTMGGAENPDYDLLRELRRYDFHGLWSYFDLPAEPGGGLNLLDFPAPSWQHTAGRAWKHLRTGSGLIAAHYLRTATLLRLGNVAGKAVGRAFSGTRAALMDLREGHGSRAVRSLVSSLASALRTLGQPRIARAERAPSIRDLQRVGPTLYPERGTGLSQCGQDDLLLFTTFEVHHVSDAYTPEALDELLDQRGLHIGHCYLLNRLPYLAGLFRPDREAPTPSKEWLGFLEALEAAVRDGRLWNPTAGALMDWVRRWTQVEIIPLHEQAVRLDNLGSEPVHDLTLVLPRAVQPRAVSWDSRPPAGWRSWDDGLAVWGSVPARRAVEVQWGGSLT